MGWARRKKFHKKSSQMLENAVLRLAFAKSAFYKRDKLLIFEAEFTESVVII